MVRLLHLLIIPALLAGVPVLAQGRSEFVQDEAGIFSAAAKAKANAEIARVQARFKKELVVDTLFAVKLPEGLDGSNEAVRNRFFDKWAEDRFLHEKITGVYVVIVGEPPIIRVQLGNHTKQSGLFTDSDRADLRDQIIANMKETRKDLKDQAKRDHVLLAATAFFSDRVSQHGSRLAEHRPQTPVGQHQGQNAPGAGVPWLKYLLIGGAVLLIFWLVMGVMRGASRGASGPGMMGGGGGGGGFFSSMLGGLFGAAAGMWLYNNVFGGQSNSAWGSGNDGGSGAINDGDTGSTGDGGDYGGTDDGSGGDAGGGGGDWGGGGGDFGGGGGDFGGGGGGGDW